MINTSIYRQGRQAGAKVWLLFWGLLCLAGRPAAAQTLVWEDNFEGTTINPNNWTFDFGDGCERGNCGWGNQELEYYTSRPENARLENGNLRIEARREAFGGKPFTSARLKTYGRVHFKYGTLEARIKVPNLQNGLWPAFWMLGTTGNWPASGEIDLLEMGAQAAYPDNANKWASAAVHWSYKGSQADYGQIFKSATSLTDDYHVYKLVWDASTIKVFIDGTQYFAVDISKAESDMEEFHRPQYVLLNLAVGGSYTGKLGAGDITAPLPAAMLVDYIRLYQNPGDELYLGKDHAFAGDYGVYSERPAITDKLAYDGLDANLYYWHNLINITAPAPVPFEGQQVLAVHAAGGDWFGMGVDNLAKNLSNFATGALKFQFKTTYAGQFKVGVKSGFGESWVNFPAGATPYGLVRDGSWHEVSIPLSAFDQPSAGMHLDLGSMNALFMFAGDAASSAADFYFDDIRYTGAAAANPAPTVAITAPANEAVVPVPASLTITATAADANGTVAKVEFYQGSTKLGEATAAPYSYTWAAPAAGTYVLTAKATDNEGATTTSAPVTVYVAAPGNAAPTVSLTAPTATASFVAPASITLAATAADADGTVAKVEFYQGSTKLGEATASPYTYTWAGVAAGTYALTAKATDNQGATTTSAAVSVSVTAGGAPSAGGYCGVVNDFAFKAEAASGNVTFTFHPLGATAGGNLAIVYVREGDAGAYPGYTMAKNAAGDFTFTRAIADGTLTNIYFTYQVGAGGPERNTAATPFSYTVGAACATPLAAGQPLATAATFSVYPNPASRGRAAIALVLAQAASYEVALYDLKGARLQTVGAGRAPSGREVTLELNTSGLASGIYLLKAVSDTGVLTRRFVVNR